eukprot:TRINITY_DN19954_c0_g1_i3.p1 TRINITY_DN19954_c0_g1~~TRINITY_DN19954_c0_g1_i3.p1  ORF type:complete len:585 (-),score=96.50 TRINITY_DN19954_c0_g1_i3:165-1760(-)
MRLEPYTSYYLKMQGGKFDSHAIRSFWSIEETWSGCMNNPSDVKELIPELFVNPEIFENVNNLNFGTKPDGKSISEVILPPWSNGNPFEFIEIHRMALARLSEEESHQLSGQAFSEEFVTVFQHKLAPKNKKSKRLTERALKSEGDKDEIRFLPSQRELSCSSPLPLSLPSRSRRGILPYIISEGIFTAVRKDNNKVPLIHIHVYKNGRLNLIFEDGVIIKTWFKFNTTSTNEGNQHQLSPSFGLPSPERNEVAGNYPLLFAPTISPKHYHLLFSYVDHNNYQYLYTGGHWDGSLHCLNINSMTNCNKLYSHKNTVTAIAISSDGNLLISGSEDCTCLVWDAVSLRTDPMAMPRQILSGHKDAVIAISILHELDLIVTASHDGTCILYNKNLGTHLCTITYPHPVVFMEVSRNGRILCYCNEDGSSTPGILFIHSVNGKILGSTIPNHPVTGILLSEFEKHLIVAQTDGTLTLYSLFLSKFKIIHEWKGKVKACSLSLLPSKSHDAAWTTVLVGSEDGKLWMVVFSTNSKK